MLLLGVRVETALGDPAAATEYANRLTHDFANSSEAAALLQEQGARP
jgi:Tfp pilus assembly protein PilF